MLKRKRGQYEGHGRAVEVDPKKEVEAKIVHGKKVLNKALKLAKTFERQKLNKRIKLVEKENGAKEGEKERLNRELEVLMALDISQAVDAHLYKSLLKTKAIVESNLLPSYVTAETKKDAKSEEEMLALNNVTARMYNTKPAKEAMAQIMSTVYAAVGVPNPGDAVNKGKKQKMESKAQPEPTEDMDEEVSIPSESGDEMPQRGSTKKAANNGVEPAWDGFDSGSESGSESEDLSRYDALIAASSDEESDEDDSDNAIPRATSKASKVKTLNPRDMSVTPSAGSRTPSPSPSFSEPETKIKAPKAPKAAKPKTKPVPTKPGSTFLPTLMGGYWSGSESSASDIEEDAAPPPRKNRRGQQARRLIWEKKYGVKAAHIKAGKPHAGTKTERDAGWDAKRGATAEAARPDKGRGGRNGFKRNFDNVTGENAAPLGERRGRGLGKKDDVGILHPSWVAAKKAKDEKKNVEFKGKKVTFD